MFDCQKHGTTKKFSCSDEKMHFCIEIVLAYVSKEGNKHAT
jgi:hypothetical protein